MAFVQSGGTNDEVAKSFTFGTNVTNGNVLALAITWLPGTTSLTSITTDRSGSATLLDNPTAEAANSSRGAQAVVALTSSGSCTVTASFSAAITALGFIGHEYSDIDTANIVDNSGAAHIIADCQNLGTGTDAYTSGNITTATANAIVFGWLADINVSDHVNSGTNFTARITSQVGTRIESEDLVKATAGTVAATFTQSQQDFLNALVGAIALTPSSSGPGAGSDSSMVGVTESSSNLILVNIIEETS